jgi:hypothetical protein
MVVMSFALSVTARAGTAKNLEVLGFLGSSEFLGEQKHPRNPRNPRTSEEPEEPPVTAML